MPRFARNDRKRRTHNDKTGEARNGTFTSSLRGTTVPKQSRWAMRLPRFARNDKTGRGRNDRKRRTHNDKTGEAGNDEKESGRMTKPK